MGLMGRVLGMGRTAERIGDAVGGVAEVFVGNAAEREQAEAERMKRALEQFGAEFAQAPSGPYDRFVNSLNRLPRPLLALGTLSLFIYAMADPHGFSLRMTGLNLVPEPLWWLLGAVVSFYFGARELHHFRNHRPPVLDPGLVTALTPPAVGPMASSGAGGSEPTAFLGSIFGDVSFGGSGDEPAVAVRAGDPEFNAAVEEWRITRVRR